MTNGAATNDAAADDSATDDAPIADSTTDDVATNGALLDDRCSLKGEAADNWCKRTIGEMTPVMKAPREIFDDEGRQGAGVMGLEASLIQAMLLLKAL